MTYECIAVTGVQRVVLYERPKGQERNVCINSLSVFFCHAAVGMLTVTVCLVGYICIVLVFNC